MVLKGKQLAKKFGNIQVLKSVDLQIESGELVSIVGPSGAGKTTLLQILGTLDKPDTGSLEILGKNPIGLNPKNLANFRNKYIGFVFQFHYSPVLRSFLLSGESLHKLLPVISGFPIQP